jgi:hypothetical protein
MTQQLCKRDLAIMERGLAIPNVVTLAVRTDEVSRKLPVNGIDVNTIPATPENSTVDCTILATKPPRTFQDRIAGSPQLVSGTITRAIKLAAHRERLAALKPVMAVRMATFSAPGGMAGSK